MWHPNTIPKKFDTAGDTSTFHIIQENLNFQFSSGSGLNVDKFFRQTVFRASAGCSSSAASRGNFYFFSNSFYQAIRITILFAIISFGNWLSLPWRRYSTTGLTVKIFSVVHQMSYCAIHKIKFTLFVQLQYWNIG